MTQLRWIPALVLALSLAGCAHKQAPCDGCGAVPPPPGARIVPAPPPGATVIPGPPPQPTPFQPGPGGVSLPQDPSRPQFPSTPSANPVRPPDVQGQVRLPDDLFAPGNVQQSGYRPNNDAPTVRLAPPTRDEPPVADTPAADRTGKTPLAAPPAVDVPEFAEVRPGVFVGLQPSPDGIGWLQGHGYRTVLHLRSPEATDTAAQRVFEYRRIGYVSLQVAPRQISREAVEAFNRVVADPAARPLFVFDGDGSLVPGMFYLHFRTAGGMTHEQALAAAAKNGFRPDTNANHQAFLQAAALNGQ